MPRDLLFPPPEDLPKGFPLPCPPIQKRTSPLRQKFWFYVHEYVLVPFAIRYARFYGLSLTEGVYPLPFGLVIKSLPNVRESEAIAMNLACAMGIPAPKALTFGDHDPGTTRDKVKYHSSILMTRLPGIDLDKVSDDQIDLDVIREDLVKILTRMRSFGSPFGSTICGVDGGPVFGPLIPFSPLPASENDATFRERIKNVTHPREYGAVVEEFFSLPSVAPVFTHGDLNRHNIMVTPDGHVSGIFDWEAAGWLPEYWEVSVTAQLPTRKWGRFMREEVTRGVYDGHCKGHSALLPFVSDSFRW
ncbi:hypothetical protein NLI96_g10730 [Meripilus lineatus]|uniref:Aminoglycoside phosphotransferase domain-containing protein n=1 Tax=Meripilus lineatus TaxID=2056292 RepID=A0AAD5Y9U6_9APHY|nr:hypothetical protein NLI96_g10730 [Physisporinus lineatus]